jgi:ubiquinone/menaquinone biosynthesis C-methylase UbiE
MQALNLGCGYRFHPTWTNIDFIDRGQSVITHNLLRGIPAENCTYDFVYHSHLLEHLPKSYAPAFLAECYRVLKPAGILRVVIPDLENIIQNYIWALEEALRGSEAGVHNYNWILLELFDQLVRDRSGGEIADYLTQQEIPNLSYITQRWGIQAKVTRLAKQSNATINPHSLSWLSNLTKPIYRFFRYPKYRYEWLVKQLLKAKDYQALEIGRFRMNGEIHHWMYDRFSLQLLLEKSGFINIKLQSATASYMSNWSSYNLDTEPDGSVCKPDSLFMEAIKPSL